MLPFSCQYYFFLANLTAIIISVFIYYNLLKLPSLNFSSCLLPQVNHYQNFICCLIMKIHVQKQKQSLILFHISGMMITLTELIKKNRQGWCCNKTPQGINATKALAHVLKNKGIHIKSCYAYTDKEYTTIYQELQHFKQAWKGVIHDYSEKSKHPFQVYIIIHLLSSNSPYTTVKKLSLHQTTLMYMKCEISVLH